MPMLIHKWTVDPLQFVSTVKASVAKKTEEVAEAVFDGVVDKSPVFTGSFRASWSAMVGTPTFQYIVGGTPNNPLRRPVWPKLKVKDGEAIHVTNGAPYAWRLEQGHSGQAPNGMVALTIASL